MSSINVNTKLGGQRRWSNVPKPVQIPSVRVNVTKRKKKHYNFLMKQAVARGNKIYMRMKWINENMIEKGQSSGPSGTSRPSSNYSNYTEFDESETPSNSEQILRMPIHFDFQRIRMPVRPTMPKSLRNNALQHMFETNRGGGTTRAGLEDGQNMRNHTKGLRMLQSRRVKLPNQGRAINVKIQSVPTL